MILNKLIQKQTNIINQIEGNISLRNEFDTIKALCKNIKLRPPNI